VISELPTRRLLLVGVCKRDIGVRCWIGRKSGGLVGVVLINTSRIENRLVLHVRGLRHLQKR
jgi:hypothetical protein